MHHDVETRLCAYLAELSETPPPPGLGVVERRGHLLPRRWLRPTWVVGAVLAVVVVSVVTFAYHRATTGAPPPGGAASFNPSIPKATRVIRVEINVPHNGLTFQVARGTVLALTSASSERKTGQLVGERHVLRARPGLHCAPSPVSGRSSQCISVRVLHCVRLSSGGDDAHRNRRPIGMRARSVVCRSAGGHHGSRCSFAGHNGDCHRPTYSPVRSNLSGAGCRCHDHLS